MVLEGLYLVPCHPNARPDRLARNRHVNGDVEGRSAGRDDSKKMAVGIVYREAEAAERDVTGEGLDETRGGTGMAIAQVYLDGKYGIKTYVLPTLEGIAFMHFIFTKLLG